MIRNPMQTRHGQRRTRAAALSALYVAGLWTALFHIAFDNHHCHSHCAPESTAAATLLPGDHAPCGRLHHDLSDHRDLGNAETKAPPRGPLPMQAAVIAGHDPEPTVAFLTQPRHAARPLPVRLATASSRAPPRLLSV